MSLIRPRQRLCFGSFHQFVDILWEYRTVLLKDLSNVTKRLMSNCFGHGRQSYFLRLNHTIILSLGLVGSSQSYGQHTSAAKIISAESSDQTVLRIVTEQPN